MNYNLSLVEKEAVRKEIPRRALLARIGRATPRILVLTAPAGYGKSTLARQYSATFAKRANCDFSEVSGLGGCARALLTALADESPERSETIRAFGRQSIEIDATATGHMILSAWEAPVKDSIFIFDGVDRLVETGLEEILARLLEALPRGRTVVISSRKPLRLRLNRFAASHEILTLRAADLAFGGDEIAALGCVESDAKAICATSHGWPVVVSFLAQLAGQPKFDLLLPRLDDVIFEHFRHFLSVEVLAPLEPALVEAMATIACIPDATDHDLAVLGIQTPIEYPPFVKRSSKGRYSLLPLLRRPLLASRSRLQTCVLALLVELHLRGESYLRAAQIAIAAGNEEEAAMALDCIEVWERLPEREFADVLAKIDPAIIAVYPKLWFFWAERHKYSINPSTALTETREMWERLPEDVARSTRAAIFDKLVNRLLRLGHIGEALKLIDEQSDRLGAGEVPLSLEEADLVLVRSIVAARFGRFAERARLIESIERGVGFTKIMLLRERLERAVHVERVLNNYQKERAVLDKLVKDLARAGLPEWSLQALGHAVFGAWLAGDRVRAASLSQRFAALVREHGFVGLEHFAQIALGQTDVRLRGIEASVWLAQAHLIAWHNSEERSAARYHATAARDAADAWGNPFLRILSRVAVAQLEPDNSISIYAEARALAEPIESPALHRALDVLQTDAAEGSMLAPLVSGGAPKRGNSKESALVVAVLRLEVTYGGRTVAVPDRELQLLVALALGREGLRREELCELLWPELAEEAARVALKSCAYRLRMRFGARHAIVVSQGVVRLGSGASVDLWEIAEVLTEWRTGNETSPSTLAKLRIARTQLAGPFAPQLLQWEWFADRIRSILELRIRLTSRLAEAALARDDAAEALELAREIEAQDPTDELGCALAIRALRCSGDEVGVERSYRRFCETLRRELDIEPSAALERLYLARERDSSMVSVA